MRNCYLEVCVTCEHVLCVKTTIYVYFYCFLLRLIQKLQVKLYTPLKVCTHLFYCSMMLQLLCILQLLCVCVKECGQLFIKSHGSVSCGQRNGACACTTEYINTKNKVQFYAHLQLSDLSSKQDQICCASAGILGQNTYQI